MTSGHSCQFIAARQIRCKVADLMTMILAATDCIGCFIAVYRCASSSGIGLYDLGFQCPLKASKRGFDPLRIY